METDGQIPALSSQTLCYYNGTVQGGLTLLSELILILRVIQVGLITSTLPVTVAT